MTDKIKLTPKRITFIKTYNDFNNEEILRELLFAQQLQIDKLEKIRSNTSKLVWWLIALPIIFGFFTMLLGLGRL
ncbi:hypothetical protein HNV08_07235 [Winogradskyella eckloniae]|uniref:hypothetical protein n=1 Tax=Winogradskyella eckloniae TaxID=1089306 RepID=UPI0015679B5C|nr:hypothetical protein [Winogradskyella eckloniae]NRD19839.1 hypothetical protein [Winogradskyella eckloniae]